MRDPGLGPEPAAPRGAVTNLAPSLAPTPGVPAPAPWHVHAAGDPAAPPLVLLHGFGADGRVWEPLAARLAARWRVLAFDLPGHGRSPAPAGGLPVAAAALATQLPLGATVVGYSLGGRLALHLALVRPDLAGLVVIGASAGLADAAERAERAAVDMRWEALLADGLAPFRAAWEAQPIFATRQGHAAAVCRAEQDPAALAAAMRAYGLGHQAPIHARLRRLATPAVVLVGAHDAKFQAIARTLVGLLPAAQLSVAPDAGHDVPTENPDAVLAAIAQLGTPKGAPPWRP